MCEPTGYCSFPDAACESGQRYGDYAGGLAGQCVVDDDIPTSGVTAASATGTGTGGPMTATSNGPSDGTTSEPVATSSPTADDSSGDAATTGPLPECWVEEFEDDLLDGTWWFWVDPGVVAAMGGGDAEFELAETPGYGGMGTNFTLDVTDKTATWNFKSLPDLDQAEVYEVLLASEIGSIRVEIGFGTLTGYWDTPDRGSVQLFSEFAPPGDLEIVRLAESGGALTLTVVDDSGNASEVLTFEAPLGWDPTQRIVEFRAGATASNNIAGDLKVESVSVCPSP